MSDHDHDHTQGDSSEELIREMAKRLAETPVRDLLLQTMATFADLAGVRLGFGPDGAAPRDLSQARLAIETLRALIGVAEAQVGAAQVRPFREPLAQLQMLYAQAVEAEAAANESAAASAESDAESAIWTPGSDGQGEARIWTPEN